MIKWRKKTTIQDSKELSIIPEALQPDAIDEGKLIPLKDNALVGRLVDTIPSLQSIITTAKGVSELGSICKQADGLYRVIIPKGAELFDSKAMDGAKRAIFKTGKGFGHGNLVSAKNDVQKTVQEIAKKQVTANVFQAASMVVGQYYMSQINGQLEKLSSEVGQIKNFQDSEFLSKITSTLKQIKEITEFRAISLESEELRLGEKKKLDELKICCIQLLDQSNISIGKLVQNKPDNFKDYIEQANEIDVWVKYSDVLLKMVHEICSLGQVFSLGLEPSEKAFSTFNQCLMETEKTHCLLGEYHKKNQEQFGIKIESKSRSKGKIIEFIADLVKQEKWKQRQIPEDVVAVLSEQMKPFNFDGSSSLQKFGDDVVLIAKDGQLFYLPEPQKK